MSESRLRAFADDALLLVDVPDLESLERRGHDLRNRRRTAVVASLVLVALLGTWVVQDRTTRADGPDTIDTPARPVVPYPGNRMQTMPAGTYELRPSADPDDPTVLVTLPDGWNNWEGPNRFDGHQSDDPTTGRYNEPALVRASWYVGLVVAKLVAVAGRSCPTAFAREDFLEGFEPTVSALVHLPGMRVLQGPERVNAFGYPAVHVVAEETKAARSCESDVFLSSRNGAFGTQPWTELWVVDVDGVPLTVFTSYEGDPPRKYLDELASVVASIEFSTADER